jgi:hypothetical protein
MRRNDAKIARYRTLRNGVNDRNMVDYLTAFIADLEAEKITLHQLTEK